MTNIIHLYYGVGKTAYASVIKYLNDGLIVANPVSRRNDTLLAIKMLKKSIEANLEAEPLIHSDPDSQHISKKYCRIMTKAGMTRSSMLRTGNCFDNASIENFYVTLNMKSTTNHLLSFESLRIILMSI